MPDQRTLNEPLSLNGRLRDRFVRHDHHVERAKAGIASDVSRYLRDTVFSDLGDRLTVRIGRIRRRRDVARIHTTAAWSSLREMLRDRLTDGYRTARLNLAESLRELAVQESRFVVRVFGEEFAFDYSAKIPALREFRRAVTRQPINGHTLGEWFGGLSRKAESDVLSETNIGLQRGESTDQIIRRVLGRKGVFDKMLRETETIVETAAGHAAGNGRALAVGANGEVVAWETWSAILDSNTCFPAGHLVRTPCGWAPIERLLPGDRVLTHKGRFRRVIATRSKEHSGKIVTMRIGGRTVTATPDHRFLTPSGWEEIGDLGVGSSLLVSPETPPDSGYHRGCFFRAVERRVADAENAKSLRSDTGVTAGVAPRDVLVPVLGIDLEAEAELGKEEVDGPSADAVLLDEVDPERRETEPDVPLRRGLPSELSIARKRAELSRRPVAGTDLAGERTEGLSAVPALQEDRGAPTVLRAVPASAVSPEKPSALPTLPHRGQAACSGAPVVSAFVASRHGERLPAGFAGLRHVAELCKALPRACAAALPAFRRLKRATADNTRFLNRWLRRLTVSWVRMRPLVKPVAAARTEPLGVPCERGSADLASPLSWSHVSRYVVHNTGTIKVYDIQVEEDASFVVEGVVAHNCPVCAATDGKRFRVGEGPPAQSLHVGCRCSRVPAIRSAKDLGLKEGDLPEIERRAMDGRVPEKTTYAKWLKAQPAAVQDDVLGKGRAALWRDGKVTINQMVDARLRPISLRDLKEKI